MKSVRLFARTGRWLQSLDRIENGFSHPAPSTDDIADLMTTVPSHYGSLHVVKHPIALSDTPVSDDLAPIPYPGSLPPEKAVNQ